MGYDRPTVRAPPKTPGCRDTQGQKPVLRASKVGRWRAIVLLAVHALMALHVAHWLETGSTLSPVEPSEAMELSKHGIVNAGAIFFGLTIASTLVFGRFFCGWACHVVALQDACRWILLKLGVRPRPVFLGPLLAVPWAAFAYMFLAPFLYRLIAGEPPQALRAELFTQNFFATFPDPRTGFGLWVIVATLLVCGFAIVVFLGSKAFCTHGCPYGGIFGVADQLAPVRIRVTDACEGCGHCTASCTSNVDVRSEVRDFGMVVSAGCMKCLDCISVCPKDALYVGLGKPAIAAKPRRAGVVRPRVDLARFALLAVFLAALYLVFLGYDGGSRSYAFVERVLEPELLKLAGLLTAMSLVVAWFFRPRSGAAPKHTFVEEALLAVAFVAAMLAFRGLHDHVPFLFALGLSTVLAWVATQGLRLVRVPDVRLQRWTLKDSGTWTRAGAIAAAATLVIGVGWAFAGREQLAIARAAIVERERPARALALYNEGVAAGQANRIDEAIRAFEGSLALDPTSVVARENLAGMYCATGRFADGLREFEVVIAQSGGDADTRLRAGFAAAQVRDLKRARALLEDALRLAPGRNEIAALLADVLEADGDAAGARALRSSLGR